MNNIHNEFGQSISFPLADWVACSPPPRTPMVGRTCTVEPLDLKRHGADLAQAFVDESTAAQWTYLPYGPFATQDEYLAWLTPLPASEDPFFHAVLDTKSGRAIGVCSFMRIEPAIGVMEVGHIHFSPGLQKQIPATEAMYLMMKRAFDELGYRRYEWKCDSLNSGSRRAAKRLGFTFEGIFRQATMYKGRNRDTAWFSILDSEWPRLRDGFERWLEPDNFNDEMRQKRRLGNLIK